MNGEEEQLPKHPLQQDMDEVIGSLSQHNSEHVDENGLILPKYLNDEIRNKISKIGSKADLLGRYKGLSEDDAEDFKNKGVNEILRIFPDNKDLIKQAVRENPNLKNQISLLDEDTPDTNQ